VHRLRTLLLDSPRRTSDAAQERRMHVRL